MRSLQLELRHQWDFEDDSVVIWTPSNELEFLWWSNTNHLLQGVSLEVQYPDLLFWSDASNDGWGANMQDRFVSGHWSVEERSLSFNLRELRAIRLGLQHFCYSLGSHSVYRQHHGTVVHQEAGGDVLRCDQPGSAAPPPVGRIVGAYASSPIHHGDQERGGRLPEPSSTSAGFRVDLGLGGCERLAGDVASYCRSFHHSPQLAAPGLVFATERPHGSRHGRFSLSMGRASGVCVPAFRAHSPGPEQASGVQGDLS